MVSNVKAVLIFCNNLSLDGIPLWGDILLWLTALPSQYYSVCNALWRDGNKFKPTRFVGHARPGQVHGVQGYHSSLQQSRTWLTCQHEVVIEKKQKQIFMVCGRFLKKVTRVKSLELLFIWTWLELECKHILTFTYFIRFPISSSAMLIDVWKFHLKENDNIAYSSYFLFLLIELNWWVKYKFLSL